MPLAIVYVAQVLQISAPRHAPSCVSPTLSCVAVAVMACCEVPMALDCGEFENRLPMSWAMVAVCWLLPSGTTNIDASVIISNPPISTPGSTMRRRGAGAIDSGLVRVRLVDAGMTIGILTLVLVDGSGAVEVIAGN